ncbi:MAG: hypothetical protein QXX30_04270 [Candidatus Aenigmatarchaeota archaeon]
MYETERKIFTTVRKRILAEIGSPVIDEFEKAIRKLIFEYNTTLHENRFIVGGSLEIIFCSLLISLGFNALWLKERRFDISIDGSKFSLKSNLSGNGDIRLINVLGNEVAEWREPTIFFIGGRGIFYADPEMEIRTYSTGDATILKLKDLLEFNKRTSEWFINIKIPKKLKAKKNKIRTASYDVVKSILNEENCEILFKNLPEI